MRHKSKTRQAKRYRPRSECFAYCYSITGANMTELDAWQLIPKKHRAKLQRELASASFDHRADMLQEAVLAALSGRNAASAAQAYRRTEQRHESREVCEARTTHDGESESYADVAMMK